MPKPQPRQKISKARRYVVRQLMLGVAVRLVSLEHEFWRAFSVEADGLTQKEYVTALDLHGRLKSLREEISDLANALK